LKLPSNTRQILDSWHPQQIPLGVSLFNGYDKPSFLLGYFLVKPGYQLFACNPQFLGLSFTGQFLILSDFILALVTRETFNLFRNYYQKLP
jgi:hypothetical protein